jgi:hypothetical protein
VHRSVECCASNFNHPPNPFAEKLGLKNCWKNVQLSHPFHPQIEYTYVDTLVYLKGLQFQSKPGGYKGMSSILVDQWAPSYMSPNAGGGECCRVSANEYSCGHHVTWSPNTVNFWRSNSIFNQWSRYFHLPSYTPGICTVPTSSRHQSIRPPLTCTPGRPSARCWYWGDI